MQSHQAPLKTHWESAGIWNKWYLGELLHFIQRVKYRAKVTDITCYAKNEYTDHWGRL
jgi:hypothetical protein